MLGVSFSFKLHNLYEPWFSPLLDRDDIYLQGIEKSGDKGSKLDPRDDSLRAVIVTFMMLSMPYPQISFILKTTDQSSPWTTSVVPWVIICNIYGQDDEFMLFLDYALQYSSPEDSMDCIVHGITKGRT